MIRFCMKVRIAILRFTLFVLLLIACYQMYLLNYHLNLWLMVTEKVKRSGFSFGMHINSHPISSEILGNNKRTLAGEKPIVLLAVGILSQLRAIHRRQAIRATWLKVCDENMDRVVCKFFTDPIDNSSDKLEEQRNFDDIEYMPIKSGINFALRLVWMLQYFSNNYEYDFFLRIDDDYFLCLDRLLNELPYRRNHSIYWGYIHCYPHIVRVDEGFMILSRDIISEALGKLNTTLPCHSFGDQAVALWMQDSALSVTYFSDNIRVIHEVTSYRGSKYFIPNICENYIGLHGTYPVHMHRYWKLWQDYKTSMLSIQYKITKIKDFQTVCPFPKEFDYRHFHSRYYDTPVLCKYNPTFRHSTEPYHGREEVLS